MKLEALYNAVVVKPVEIEETTYGSIIVPDMGNELNKTAEVVGVGPGFYSPEGVLIISCISFFLIRSNILSSPSDIFPTKDVCMNPNLRA